jgi:flavin-binding protein dodecin
MRAGLKQAVATWLQSLGVFDDGSIVVGDIANRKVSMQKGMAIVSAPTHPVTRHRQHGLKTELYSIVVSAAFFNRDHAGDSTTDLADAFKAAVNQALDSVRDVLWDSFTDRADVISQHFNSVTIGPLESEMPDQQNVTVSFVVEVELTRKVSGDR